MSKFAPLLFALVVTLIPSLAMALGEPKKGSGKKETPSLQGTWNVESQIISGKENRAFPMTITFEGSRFVVKSRLEVIQSGDVKIDISQEPNTMSLTVTTGPDKGKVVPSIFRLDGDSLKVCSNPKGKQMPTKFESPEESNIVLLVLKRLSRGADEADAKAMQGAWRVTHAEEEGKKVPLEKLNGIVITFKGNTLVMKVEGKGNIEGSFDLIPTTLPRQIDWIVKDELTAGIYKLEKDRLTICVTSIQVLGFNNKKRPAEFATKEGSRTSLMVLEKVKE